MILTIQLRKEGSDMRRLLCLTLCVLLLCGCAPTHADPTGTAAATEETAQSVTGAPVDVTEVPTNDVTLPQPLDQTQGESDVVLGTTGAVRVTYTNPISSVRYITSAAELPDEPALAGYDDAYFAEHALLVVMETVNSGSAAVSIESVEAGVVTLSHQNSGDVGTTVMTTWLLWAEVESGLAYSWSVANSAVESVGVAY